MRRSSSVDQATARRRARRHFSRAMAAVFLPLLALRATAGPAAAASQSCTEAGLDAALAAGGTQTFSCVPGSTITISGTKYVGKNVTLDGGGNLTIDGGGAYQVFSLGYNTVTFGVANLTAGATRKRGSFPEHKTVKNVSGMSIPSSDEVCFT